MANEIQNITIRVNNAVLSNKLRLTAVNTVLVVHKARIFEKGLDASDGQIGTYSTKPISISKARQARQTGKTFFEGGYAEYKAAIGKNPGFMNLRNFDFLYLDYGVIQSGTTLGLGFQSPINFNKARNIEKKQGKIIFAHDSKEIKLLIDTLNFEIAKI